MKIVFGALLLLNAFVWPLWTGIDGWIAWLAVLIVLGGIGLLFHPKGNCCSVPPVTKKKRKK